MAKQNLVLLNAKVETEPVIERNEETGEYQYGMCIMDVVRGKRAVGDNKQYIKHDGPVIISKDEYMIREMEKWKVNDYIELKGLLVSKDIDKVSKCPHCLDEHGDHTINVKQGTMIYVNPIESITIASGLDPQQADKMLLSKKEMSNQIYCIGTVIKEPRIFRTKFDTIVCDYQVAINRKYHIRTDDPSIRTDWIYVKSYGERAVEDKLRLRIGSELSIDGFIQTRNIKRKTVCPHCGQEYIWLDKSTEIVPYAVEYHKGTYRTDEELEKEELTEAENLRQIIYDKLYKQKITEEEKEKISEEIENVDNSSFTVDGKNIEVEEDDIPAHLPDGDAAE